MTFKNSDNALLPINHMQFFSNYNRTGAFNQSKIGNENVANFQNKLYSKFQKIQKQKKKFRFGGVKIAKLNKIEKN